MASAHAYPPAGAREKSATAAAKIKEKRPWGLEWRSSIWFTTLIVGIAITTDLLIYSMIVPIIPFRLQSLGYEGVSGLVGWLLFAYSGALVIFTPPIAFLSEMYKNRKIPLLCGQVALIGSQVLLMEAPAFWVMVIARIAQGLSACVIWVVGLALLCDTVPEKSVGKQLGLAMMGMSLGLLVGPPVSGALDDRFGFRAPFIFGIIITAVEFIGRLLIIERSAAERMDASLTSLVGRNSPRRGLAAYGAMDAEKQKEQPVVTEVPPQTTTEGSAGEITEVTVRVPSRAPTTTNGQTQVDGDPARLSILGLLLKLLKSPRALSAVFLTLSFGIMMSSFEPVVPLYLQSTYDLPVSKIGLIFIAGVVPSFISSPLSGWYADRGGTIVSTSVCLLGALPFWVLITIPSSLAYFIVIFAFVDLFAAATISPVTAELASVTRSLEGVGYGHVYGAFNIAYGLGSAIGPVIGGQLYDHLSTHEGWRAVCLFNAGLIGLSLVITVCYYGETTVLQRVVRYIRSRRAGPPADAAAAA